MLKIFLCASDSLWTSFLIHPCRSCSTALASVSSPRAWPREDLQLTVKGCTGRPQSLGCSVPVVYLLSEEQTQVLLAVLKLAHFSSPFSYLETTPETILLTVNYSAFLFPYRCQAQGSKGEICLSISRRAQLKPHGVPCFGIF